MPPDPGPPKDGADVDLGTLVQQLRERVAERRRAGEYPPDLEATLDRHYESVAGHRDREARLRALGLAARRLGSKGFDRQRIDHSSELPFGSQIHGVIAKAVARQTDGVLRQLSELASELSRILADIVDLIPEQDDFADLSARVDLVLDRLAAYEKAPRGGTAAQRELARRLDEVETELAQNRFHPWYSQEAFERSFRGSRQQILSAYASLADRFHNCAPVVDIGCGRGEMLELLADRGIEAYGIEIDEALVEVVRRHGYTVHLADAIAHLESLIDGSLGGIFLGQVIEHLSAQRAADLMALAALKLRPGGRLIIETVNAQSLYVYAHAFYLDPTHIRPVHPAYLEFLAREAGFNLVEIDWRSPVPAADALETVDALEAASQDGEGSEAMREIFNRNAARVNTLLFNDQDYAIIATR